MSRSAKLDMLIDIAGFGDEMSALEAWVEDGASDGICMNIGCNYVTSVEPDCCDGYCEVCNTPTVASGLVIAGII